VLATAKKTTLIERFRTHDTDTGSPEVQIAILSERIGELTAFQNPQEGSRFSAWPPATSQ
jgi:ribosomal protein S15